MTNERNALRGIRHRDEQALGWMIRQYTPYVSTIIHHIIGVTMSPADVEEVTADVFLALWDSAGKVLPGKVKPWLGQVARNKAREKLRQAGQTLPLEEDVLRIPGDDLAEQFAAREQADMINRAVLQMEQPDREIFLRHYYYGQTVVKIAEVMKMNAATVKSRLRRGRGKLREVLTEGGYTVESKNF